MPSAPDIYVDLLRVDRRLAQRRGDPLGPDFCHRNIAKTCPPGMTLFSTKSNKAPFIWTIVGYMPDSPLRQWLQYFTSQKAALLGGLEPWKSEHATLLNINETVDYYVVRLGAVQEL